METSPDDRAHGYDEQQEQEAYENAQEAGDQDAGPASTPDEGRPPDDE